MQTYVIDKPAQLRALTSSARQEIVDVLSRMGGVSAAELAEALGRPADALYYHLRELTRVGLVVRSRRSRGGREEAEFRTIAPRLALRYRSPLTPRIISSMLRLGARDFRRAFESRAVATTGSRRELWALRTTGWLTPRDLAAANRRMRALREDVSRPLQRGRLFAVTILLTPLDRSRRNR